MEQFYASSALYRCSLLAHGRLGKMFTRNRVTKTKTPYAQGRHSDEEEKWMLVEDDSILVNIDPSVYPKLGFKDKEEHETRRSVFGSTHSNTDHPDKFQSLLVKDCISGRNSKRIPSLKSRAENLQLVAGDLKFSSSEVEVSQTDAGSKYSSRGRKLVDGGRKMTMESTSLEGLYEGDLFSECNKVNRSKTKTAQCWLHGEDISDYLTDEDRAPNLSSGREPAWFQSITKRAVRQVTKTKSEVQFSDIFSKNNSAFGSCSSTEELLVDSKLESKSKLRYHERTRRRSEPERRVQEWSAGASWMNGDDTTEEHFGQAQSGKSLVLLVDQLADVRVRNMFVRQYAGRRRMGICEELEKVLVGDADGENLNELREQLNITHVLNNIFA